jgi:chorismate mutase/ribosomal protein S18 acetylase RimI-like enzyme
MPSEVDLTVRPATPDDADVLAALYLDARAASYPAIPRPVHPPHDVRRWMRSHFETPGTEVWLAERVAGGGGRDVSTVGLLLLEDDWVHSLYVAPDLTGQGIGTVLLDLAKSLRPDGLGLWVFETNARARRFYERHGFVVLRRTDGSDNEEGEPDLEMAWRGGQDPRTLAELRSRVDEIDDRLAALLAERAETTARIQQVKAVAGHAGRDAGREAEIAARMARVAPTLGEQRMRSIMDAVITASLDAAEARRDTSPDTDTDTDTGTDADTSPGPGTGPGTGTGTDP